MDTKIKEIVITEVGTRDGFQSEKKTVDTNDKILLINDLIQAGFKRIEFSSFVSPKAIPQLADADEVIKGIKRKSDTVLTALVPNLRGAIRAVEAEIDEIVVFLSASESHNNKNLNRSIKDSLIGFEEVIKLANDSNIPVHGDISTAFGCPFEGEISSQKIVEITKEYKSLGMKGVTLGDTTGMATPPVVTKAIRDIKEKVPDLRYYSAEYKK
jgi:Isopropylmalate/homocitrate/citramalate synthases